MAISKILNNVKMTTATTGTGPVTLGSAVTGYHTAAEAGISDGDVVGYRIEDGNDVEIGEGTYTASGTVLARTTVALSKISGSSGASKINLSGTATVSLVIIAPPASSIDGSLYGGPVVTGATLGLAIPVMPQGRLTLTTATPITTTDVTAATTVYYTPISGLFVPIYDGTRFVNKNISAELSCALDSTSGHTNYHQSGKNYDWFIINDSGTIRLGSGPKWDDGAVAGSNTARGTGAASTELELYQGVWVNKNSITIRFGSASGNTVSISARQATYVGSSRMTADGQTEDSFAKRFLFNLYNQKPRLMRNPTEITDTWNYTTATYRQARATATNQVEVLTGLTGNLIVLEVYAQAANTAGNVFTAAGIGVDSTSVNSATKMTPGATTVAANEKAALFAKYEAYATLGYHYYAWLEYSTASGTTTWYGDNGQPTLVQNGMSGSVLM